MRTFLRVWLLDSYWRLGKVALAALVLIFLIGHLSAGSSHHSPPAAPQVARVVVPPTATSTTTSSTVVSVTTTTTVPKPVVTTPALPSAASTAAIEFVAAWADRLLPSASWHRQVDQFCTASLVKELASTLPTNIPPGVTVTGEPSGSVDGGGGQVTVPTSWQPIHLILVHAGARWLVDTIE